MSFGGGGGVSGGINHPQYFQDMHTYLLYGSYDTTPEKEADTTGIDWFFKQEMDNAKEGNGSSPDTTPYSNQTAVSTTDLDNEIDTANSELRSLVDAIDEDSYWQAYVDAFLSKVSSGSVFPDTYDDADTVIDRAKTKAGQIASDAVSQALNAVENAPVDDAVDAAMGEAQDDYLRALNRFVGGMAEINAVNSSAFVWGIAMIERARLREASRLRRELRLQAYQAGLNVYAAGLRTAGAAQLSLKSDRQHMRDAALIDATHSMSGLLQLKVTQKFNQTGLREDSARIKYVADVEERNRNLDITVAHHEWPFHIANLAGNVLAKSAGVAAGKVYSTPPALQALSGALSFAAVGAQIGTSIEPGMGTAIGAGIGGLLGLVSSM